MRILTDLGTGTRRSLIGPIEGADSGAETGTTDERIDNIVRELSRYLATEHVARPNLIPIGTFHQALRAERERADRSGSPLSMLLLTTRAQGSIPRHAIEHLVDELRGGDSLCQIEDGAMLVLMPDTGSAGAKAVLSRILVSGAWRSSASRVIVYPDDAWGQSRGTPEALEPQAPELDKDFYPQAKRIADISIASLMILFAAPLMMALALWVKMVSSGPILFRQVRIGFGGRSFEMLKFRTMVHGDRAVEAHRRHSRSFIENDEAMPKTKAPLILGGWLLRVLCLDELPQLFNVIRGEMSIVGPRPCLPYEAEVYQQWHWRRFSMMPGITGLWQVSGKNRLTFNQMVRLDLRYARSLSFAADAAILLKTAPAIVREFLVSLGRREDP